MELVEVASGWRLQVRAAFGSRLSRLWQERPGRYSRALLETLALIAYRQPITRGEIESLRGVGISSGILKTLMEREWVRVLKPGGRLVIECGNLASACEKFLDDPESAGEADKRGQHTTWVMYGDPAWQDPRMSHHWGYSPASLEALMTAAGLANVRVEPAQFKLREPRDMRLVGDKPRQETQT